jgi:CheY-like chemotaxis protein
MPVETEFPRLAIVRRDQPDVYRCLRQKYGGELTVLWDRRAGQRRQATESPGPDRRSRERRYRPPQTWRLGFLIVSRAPRPWSGEMRAMTRNTKLGPRPDACDLSILIVDDHADMGEALRLYLTHLGGRVRVAQDGLEALQALATDIPDVILCDLNMPRMSGREFIRHLRRDPRHAHLLAIAVTGYDSLTNRERAQADGFDAYLTKPLEWETMARVLEDARHRRSLARAAGPGSPQP